MTDDLIAAVQLAHRIAVVQLAHMPNQYEQDMGQCPCGFRYSLAGELAAHVANEVIAELGLREQRTQRSYGNWPKQPQVVFRPARRYVTEWKWETEDE